MSQMAEWGNIPSDYEVGEIVGRGELYVIRKGTSKGRVCAIKAVDTDRVSEGDLEKLQREMNAMLVQNHPNLLCYYSSLMSGSEIWQVMEYMDKGTVAHFMRERLPQGFGALNSAEALAGYILQNVSQGIAYLHQEGRLHRQLQAKNVYLNGKGEVKIGDFGASYILVQDGMKQAAQTLVTSPHFSAPEVVAEQDYAMPSDVWCIGILAFEVWQGKAPFADMSAAKFTEKSVSDTLNYSELINQISSKLLQDFLRLTLEPMPSKRPTAAKLQDSKLFKATQKAAQTAQEELQELLTHVDELSVRYKATRSNNLAAFKDTIANSEREASEAAAKKELKSAPKTSTLKGIDLSALGDLMTIKSSSTSSPAVIEGASSEQTSAEAAPPTLQKSPASANLVVEEEPVEPKQEDKAAKEPKESNPTPAAAEEKPKAQKPKEEQDLSKLPASNVPVETYVYLREDGRYVVLLRTIAETKLLFAVPDDRHLEISLSLPAIPEIDGSWVMPYRKTVKHTLEFPSAIDASSAHKELVSHNCLLLSFMRKE